MFSGCTVPPDSKETKLGSSNQEASPSAGKNTAGFPTGVENMGVLQNLMGGGLSQYMGEHGGIKAMLKNICEGVHL